MNRSSRSHPHRAPAAFVLAAAALLAAAPTAAQDGARRVSIRGSVVDASTGLPLREATVSLAGVEKFSPTTADGRFGLFGVPAGSYVLLVERLGYRTGSYVLDTRADTVVGQIPLVPDPIQLQALEVTVNRFDRRVERFGDLARVLSREQILTSAVTNTKELVMERAMLRRAPCNAFEADPSPRDVHSADQAPNAGPMGVSRPSFASECFEVRGQMVQPGVFIDEIPVPGGLEDLTMYRPDEIARIEIFAGGRQVRVYTTSFMESAARRRYRPNPIVF